MFKKGPCGVDFGFKDMERKNNLIRTEEELLRHIKTEKSIKITEYKNNYILKSALNFDYQPFGEESLETLMEEFGLSRLIEAARNEFDKFKILRGWVREQWAYGPPARVPRDYDSIAILRRARNGERFWCSEYTAVFIQCALSLGYQARYVALSKGHVVAEIWSNEFKKWAVMDPTFNVHFEREGIPLSCLDLFNAFKGNKIEEVSVVEGGQSPDDISVKFGAHELTGISIKNYRYRTMDYYAQGFSIRMRNDWFTNKYPKFHPKGNMVTNSITWNGRRHRAIIFGRMVREKDIYFPLNVTTLGLERAKDGEKPGFSVFLDTFTPNFSHYIVYFDEKPREITGADSLVWLLHKGQNSFRAVSVNKFGIRGAESSISLFLE